MNMLLGSHSSHGVSVGQWRRLARAFRPQSFSVTGTRSNRFDAPRTWERIRLVRVGRVQREMEATASTTQSQCLKAVPVRESGQPCQFLRGADENHSLEQPNHAFWLQTNCIIAHGRPACHFSLGVPWWRPRNSTRSELWLCGGRTEYMRWTWLAGGL